MVRRRSVVSLAVVAAGVATVARADVNVIPRPRQFTEGPGAFTITTATRVAVEPHVAAAVDAAGALVERLAAVGLPLATVDGDAPAAGTVVLTTRGADPALGDEGYALDVTPAGVVVRAPGAAGLFYGVQTLLQLMPPAVFGRTPVAGGAVAVPAVHVVDAPRFRWRGLMLDVARHFEPKPVVLALLDQMATHKLNVFHWHLTDDQGWRLEIKKYPKLTAVGGWRDAAGFGLDPRLSTAYGPDGRYGGFYTQADVRDVLAYAAARHVTVVPEIEMPGHASAARRAYPEFFAPDPPPAPGQVRCDAGVFNAIYDPADERTFAFLQDVLGEVIDLFPSPFIHVGGDEVPKGPWLGNPADVAFMKSHHLSAEQLQSYFAARVGRFIASRGRRMVGWDEILEGGLAPGATVMSWRGTDGGRAAAAAGHDVVMTPGGYVYLDAEQGRGTEPHERGTVLTVRRVYGYEPVPDGLPAGQAGHVLGVQGNLWTEYVPNGPWAQYMVWPREAAVAEVGWTPAADRRWPDFARRVAADERRWDAMGVNYRPLADDDLTRAVHASDDGKRLVIDPLPGATVRYTTDGTFPAPDGPAYAGPVPMPSGRVRVVARYFQPGRVATPAAAATFVDGRPVAAGER